MIEEMAHMAGGKAGQPALGILIMVSLLRDDVPWLYEIGMDAYRAAKTGDRRAARAAMRTFQRAAELTMRGPFMEELGMESRDMHMMVMELPSLVEHMMRRFMGPKDETEDDIE